MYDAVQSFPATAKMPVTGQASVPSPGTLTYSSATYSITDNAGNAVGSGGNVDANQGSGTNLIQVFKDIDGAALSLAPGPYIVTFIIHVTDNNALARNVVYTVVLNVPGRVLNRVQYPTEADLQIRLVESGILDNPATEAQKATVDLAQALDTAIDWWEKETGYKPFLAETVDSTTYFNSENGVTDLNGGYISITSVSVNTVAKVLNQDYRTEPINALAQGKPIELLNWGFRNGIFPQYNGTFPIYTGVEFPQSGQIAAVAVTGKRGYSQYLPEAAFRSILDFAAADLVPTLEPLKFGPYQSYREGDTQYTFRTTNNKSLFSALADGWYARACNEAQYHFRRMRMA